MPWLARSVAGLLVLTAVGALSSSASASATYSSATAYSDRGDWVGGGDQRVFDSADASFVVTGHASDLTVDVNGGSSGDSVTMEFAAPPGQTLRPGVYDGAQRAAFRTSGRPGIDITSDSRGCNGDTGGFEVKDIATDSGGNVTRLWIVYEQHCEGSPPALFGEVRFNEPAPSGALVAAPAITRWPAHDFGTPETAVPARMRASTAATVRSATVVGNDAGDFPIRLDACTGQTLAAGSSCSVWVDFQPTAPGTRTATLRVTDSTGGTHDVALEGFTYGGRTRLVMHGDPGDYVGEGQDWSYTPANSTIAISGSPQHFSFTVGAGSHSWNGYFVVPTGQVLTPGVTYDVSSSGGSGQGAQFAVSSDTRSCTTSDGSFTVTYATYDANNVTQAFGVTFEQHCGTTTAALHGTFEFRVPDAPPAPAPPWMPNGTAASVPSGGSLAQVSSDCSTRRVLDVRLRRPAGYVLNRADMYIAGRRVAELRGRRLRKRAQVVVPNRPFKLVVLFHVTRHGRRFVLRESFTYDACARLVGWAPPGRR
jgi:hypothetical protein